MFTININGEVITIKNTFNVYENVLSVLTKKCSEMSETDQRQIANTVALQLTTAEYGAKCYTNNDCGYNIEVTCLDRYENYDYDAMDYDI